MKISQLYTYPIKSFRPVSLVQTSLTPHGLPYDRRFLLLRIHNPDADPRPKPRSASHYNPTTGLENMTITYYNELSLFQPTIDDERNVLVIAYHPPSSPDGGRSEKKQIEIPLEPAIEDLETIHVDMHGSPTQAHLMDDNTNRFFSECLGYATVLAYLGPHRRKVLGNIAPKSAAAATTGVSPPSQSWLGSMVSGLPSLMGLGAKEQGEEEDDDGADKGITFADIAPYLVVTAESLDDVSRRLQGGLEMDVTKFRPNIVLEGAEDAWDEDFWGGVVIKCGDDKEKEKEIILTSNCARCVSVNVDYETGQQAAGDEGKVLKKLMADRRVDRGTKWSPIFGRYGFLKGEECGVSVGDKVMVSTRNTERTTFEWPGMGS